MSLTMILHHFSDVGHHRMNVIANSEQVLDTVVILLVATLCLVVALDVVVVVILVSLADPVWDNVQKWKNDAALFAHLISVSTGALGLVS